MNPEEFKKIFLEINLSEEIRCGRFDHARAVNFAEFIRKTTSAEFQICGERTGLQFITKDPNGFAIYLKYYFHSFHFMQPYYPEVVLFDDYSGLKIIREK